MWISDSIQSVFRRNKNNSDIDHLRLRGMPDITDEMMGEIVDIIAASASHNVREIALTNLANVEKLPQSLHHFFHLKGLDFDSTEGLKILPSGSINNLLN